MKMTPADNNDASAPRPEAQFQATSSELGTASPKRRRVVAAILLAVVLAAFVALFLTRPGPQGRLNVKTSSAGRAVTVDVIADPLAKLMIGSQQAVADERGRASVGIDLLDFPVGNHAIKVQATSKAWLREKTVTETVTIVRELEAVMVPPPDKSKTLHCTGAFRCSGGYILGEGTNITARIQTDEGNVVIAGGKNVTATSKPIEVSFDVADKLAKLPADRLTSSFSGDNVELLSIPITIRAPSGVELSGTVQVWEGKYLSYLLVAAFNRATTTPLTFAGEGTSPAKPRGIYYGQGSEVVGKPESVEQVDWVAVTTRLPSRQKGRCGPYVKSGDHYGSEVDANLHDEEVKVYDRRTTEVVATRKFAGKRDCPLKVDSRTALEFGADRSEIIAWLTSFLQ